MFCRNYGSDQIRRLALVYQHGLTFINTRTSGVGIGTGVIAGAGRTHGHHMTAASASAAPPARRNSTPQVALAIGCFCLGFPYHIVWIGAMVFGIAAAISIDWNRREWPRLYSTWDAKYMCDRCGAVDFPASEAPRETVSADYGTLAKPNATFTPALEAEAG
ncbi:MAG: hypothetical protein M3N13_04500, partial [Candidatus Eremiobacteraeota bacterium]|nr:hypothetical protein [Candidatus Eremiobacteraeota bacterium]